MSKGNTFGAMHLKREEGQAIVEFSLVIIFLFFLIISILQMILLMSAYNTAADAAKEGVRYAIVHGTQNSNCSGPGDPTQSPVVTCTDSSATNVQAAVVNFAALSFQNVTTGDVTVSYNPADQNGTCANGPCTQGSPPTANLGCSAPGCMVKVVVSHTYTPFFGLSWPNVTLNAAAEGRIMN
jgi:Flp pilus assembly protein TadG